MVAWNHKNILPHVKIHFGNKAFQEIFCSLIIRLPEVMKISRNDKQFFTRRYAFNFFGSFSKQNFLSIIVCGIFYKMQIRDMQDVYHDGNPFDNMPFSILA